MKSFNLFVLCCCLLALSTSAEGLPKWITPCSRKSVTTNDCIKENIVQILQGVREGSADRDFPSLDPLFIEKATTPDAVGAVSIKQDYTNFTFSGISNSTITQLKANFDKKCQIKFKSHQPTAEIHGNYAAKGRLLLFQVKGSGKFDIVTRNMDIITTVDCEFFDMDGEQYMQIKKVNLQVRPESGHINYPNIVENNEELSDTMNKLLNENFIDVFREYSPTLLDTVVSEYVKISNKMLNGIPTKVLFKD